MPAPGARQRWEFMLHPNETREEMLRDEKIKELLKPWADFHQVTRRHTGAAPVTTQTEFEQLSFALLGPIFPVQKGIRLLGVTMSSLGEERVKPDDQLNLCI